MLAFVPLGWWAPGKLLRHLCPFLCLKGFAKLKTDGKLHSGPLCPHRWAPLCGECGGCRGQSASPGSGSLASGALVAGRPGEV